MSPRLRISFALLLTAGCGAGTAPGSSDDDGVAPDGAPTADARPGDGQPGVDAAIDGAPADAAGLCNPLDLTPQQACAIALTGQVQACSIDANTGQPSQTGWLEVTRPDGAHGYLCATQWTTAGGYYFIDDREHLVDAADACCGGTGNALDWPASDPYLGVPHGPTHIKPQEQVATPDGNLRENPFAVIVASPGAAAAFEAARTTWESWGGDGQPHPGPDGTGAYYFPSGVLVNYVVVPTTQGPIIVIAPEPSLDAAFTEPVGHPADGACATGGGAPMAYIGGEVHGTVISNHSGRFGHEATIDQTDLENAAALFNCYGISITGVDYIPPGG